MYEKRLTARLTSCWERLKKSNELPLFQSFNSASIEDVWQNCMIISVNHAGGANTSYQYDRLGDELLKLYGADMAGQPLNPAVRAAPNAKIIHRIGEMISSNAPLYDDGQFVNHRAKIIKYRSCMLPFGTSEHVTHIMIGLSWREFN